jgi:hypothetical protein
MISTIKKCLHTAFNFSSQLLHKRRLRLYIQANKEDKKGDKNMKKLLFVGVISLALIVGLGVTGLAFAQTEEPETPVTPPDGTQRGGPWMHHSPFRGLLHNYMAPRISEILDISVEDFTALIESGVKPWQIAEDQGIVFDDFRSLMLDARAEAIEQALADEVITAEQAELMNSQWMHARGDRMSERGTNRGMGMGPGNGPCLDGNGPHGRGGGWKNNNP